jgi:hypothetical protein
MSLLREGGVNNDGVIFRQVFATRRRCMDQGGVFYGTPVVSDGFQISALNTDRIVYVPQTMVGMGAGKLTVRVRFRTPAAFASMTMLAGVWDATGGGSYRWMVRTTNTGRIDFLVPTNLTDNATYSYQNPGVLAVSTEYVAHWVFDGALANPNRSALYLNGSSTAKSDTAALPAALTIASRPLCIGGEKTASNGQAGYIIRDVCAWGRALNSVEVADDAADLTYGGM